MKKPSGLFDSTASGADVELGGAVIMGMAAADEGVERLDLVDESGGHQEVEGPVDRRRLGRARPRLQGFEQVIGLYRPVRFKHEFEHPSADRGELLASLEAVRFGGGERVGQGINHHLANI